MRAVATWFSILSCLAFSMMATEVTAVGDSNEGCPGWAEAGECDKNPDYMYVYCEWSCEQMEKAAAKTAEELKGIKSFFDLHAVDLEGTTVQFEEFRGKVTILVNVASFCGYTKSHYEGLVELWSHVENEEVEILAFPCNQFGEQEPGSAEDIMEFAEQQGVRFRMMQKIKVNGPEAHLVYKYLKEQAGPKSITWNFATYFVVSPDGEISSHSGVEPMDLKSFALGLLKEEL